MTAEVETHSSAEAKVGVGRSQNMEADDVRLSSWI